MKEHNANISDRMIDDKEEERFWNRFLESKMEENYTDDFVVPLKNELLELIDKDYSVLEIGPEWENYTFYKSYNRKLTEDIIFKYVKIENEKYIYEHKFKGILIYWYK